jgi:hypothetical protein
LNVLVEEYAHPQPHDILSVFRAPTIRPATVEDAIPLAANLRPADRAEAEGVYDDVVGGLAWGIMDSAEAWVAVECVIPGDEITHQNKQAPCEIRPDEITHPRIIAAWGVIDEGSLLVPVGRVWCMTTPLVERHARHFARESRRIVARWKRRYWKLYNTVDADYAVSVRWLEWLSFDIGPPWENDRGRFFRSFEWQADGSR